MENKTINITPINETVIIREGKALELREPEKVLIAGEIETPAIWAESQSFDKSKSHALVSHEDGSIGLWENARDHYGASISGKIQAPEVLKSLGINKTQYYTTKELAKRLKMLRHYFADAEENARVVADLNSFKAKVDRTIEQTQSDRGNKKNTLEQVVESNAPESFLLNMPIMGREKFTFLVELGLDVTDNGVRIWLESIELVEILERETIAVIQSVVERLESVGITIIYT